MTLPVPTCRVAEPEWFGTAAEALPNDADQSVLIGRIWDLTAATGVGRGCSHRSTSRPSKPPG